MRHWASLTVVPPSGTPRESWEAFCELAIQAGSTGFEGRDEEQGAVFWFPEGESEKEEDYPGIPAVRELANSLLWGEGLRVEARVEKAVDWVSLYRESFHAREVDEGIWVGPPEERAAEAVPPNALYIAIEPGSAFGTGMHETTQACLRLIAKLMKQENPPRVALDMGAGSGILSIGFVLMGGKLAASVECDEVARPNFEENTRLNGCEARVQFAPGRSVEEGTKALMKAGHARPDVILCNMLSTEFRDLLAPMWQLQRPLILSGFLVEEVDTVAGWLKEGRWTVKDELQLGDWVGVVAEPVGWEKI